MGIPNLPSPFETSLQLNGIESKLAEIDKEIKLIRSGFNCAPSEPIREIQHHVLKLVWCLIENFYWIENNELHNMANFLEDIPRKLKRKLEAREVEERERNEAQIKANGPILGSSESLHKLRETTGKE
jgi:hypothetical protein